MAVDVSGTMDSPSAEGRVEVRGIGGGATGIPPVDQLQTGFRLRDGTLTVDGLRADVAGGSLEGGGSARLFERTMARMLASPAIDFRLDGKSLSLYELITSGIVSGRISFDLTATGTTKKPKVRFRVPAGTTVEVLGQVRGLSRASRSRPARTRWWCGCCTWRASPVAICASRAAPSSPRSP